jgi:hypothetical protein
MKRKMRIDWVAYNTVKMTSEGMYSRFASARYRVIRPMLGLAQLDHEVALVQIGHDARPDELITKFNGDVVVFSKLIAPQRELFEHVANTRRELIDRFRSSGRRVLADINDDYFDHEFYGPSFRDVVTRVDGVVTSTPEMQAVVARHTPRPSFVVTDPFEGPRGELNFSPPPRVGKWVPSWLQGGSAQKHPLRLVWFGHESNWISMREAIPQLPKLGIRPVELELITSPGCGVEPFCAEFNARHRGACRLQFTPWSLEATWAGLARAMIVLLPSRPEDPTKAVKSPNRLVESLRAARFAVGDALPSYERLASYCHLGGGPAAGLRWALDRPDEVRQRIAAGQAHVEANFSPRAIASAWERVLVQMA